MKENLNEKGFSLIELVIAIGIILVLSVGGLIGYSAISKNAKQAAVESAAATVVKMIAVKESFSGMNAKSNGGFAVQNIDAPTDYEYSKPQDAADYWMATAGKGTKITIETDQNKEMIGVRALYDNNNDISSIRYFNTNSEAVEECNGNNGENVPASYNISNISSNSCDDEFEECNNDEGGIISQSYKVEKTSSSNNCDDDGETIENGPTYDNKTIDTVNPNYASEFTYNCDVTTTGNLLPYSMKSTAGSSNLKAFVKNTNNHNVETIDHIQDSPRYYINVTLEAGIEYKVVVFGTYEGLAHNLGAGTEYGNLSDCLVSVDKIAPDSGITVLGKLGGKKLEKVPATIPTTIKNFGQTFYGATKFNDPNVSNWYIRQTGNVSMNGMFANTDSFNQPLNWDVSYVGDMSSMFENAKSFNQDISEWDTSNTYNMEQMFRNAKSFNQNISDWNVNNVTKFNNFSTGSPIEGTNKIPNFSN